MDLEIPGLNPANQAVLPIPKKADPNLGDYSDFSLQVILRNVIFLCEELGTGVYTMSPSLLEPY